MSHREIWQDAMDAYIEEDFILVSMFGHDDQEDKPILFEAFWILHQVIINES